MNSNLPPTLNRVNKLLGLPATQDLAQAAGRLLNPLSNFLGIGNTIDEKVHSKIAKPNNSDQEAEIEGIGFMVGILEDLLDKEVFEEMKESQGSSELKPR